jgi:hypothetical protein
MNTVCPVGVAAYFFDELKIHLLSDFKLAMKHALSYNTLMDANFPCVCEVLNYFWLILFVLVLQC